MTKPENYPEYLCSYCTTLLLKSISFRDKCVRAMDLLNMAVLQSGMLTQSDILNVDRRYNNLVLPYVCESLLLNVKEESSPIPRDESDVESDNDFEGKRSTTTYWQVQHWTSTCKDRLLDEGHCMQRFDSFA
ncbi:hypothetical protein O3G_MSEX013881 [Manduca sexta]|uniref:Uncharacterized protein n=1 Tax=Manduca sexta TaxID=7130 RepID=A0A922CZ48_MANSE|nr:hypothetical protein O3G_MSEX013881 [Manduca sexta]